jgi:hypothetical protein
VKKQTETDVVRDCLFWLKLMGGFAVRVNSGGPPDRDGRPFRGNNRKGCSDCLVCLPWPGWLVTEARGCASHRVGRFVAVEVKRPGARTKPARLAAQQAFLEQVEARGGVGLMVESVEDLERQLRERGWAP